MNKLTSLDALSQPDSTSDVSGYESDLVLWFEKQAAYLRNKQFEQLDLDKLIEELEAMAGRDRRELKSRIEVLVMHLLKCQFQPEKKSGSWRSSIREQRSEIAILLEQSPSLKTHVGPYSLKAFERAVKRAADETELPSSAFPSALPYSPDQLLDDDFLP